MVQLSDDLVSLLDEEAARQGVSRSALIRSLLEAALQDDRETAIVRRIVEGYERVPQGAPDAWGPTLDPGDRATGELLQRLDAEEHAQGLGQW